MLIQEVNAYPARIVRGLGHGCAYVSVSGTVWIGNRFSAIVSA